MPAEEAGGTEEESNGNGSLMRILPIALRYWAEPASACWNWPSAPRRLPISIPVPGSPVGSIVSSRLDCCAAKASLPPTTLPFTSSVRFSNRRHCPVKGITSPRRGLRILPASVLDDEALALTSKICGLK